MGTAKKTRVVKRNCVPVRMPLLLTLIAGLYLDRFAAPTWLWIGVGVFLGVLWIGAFAELGNEKQIDIFKVFEVLIHEVEKKCSVRLDISENENK